MPKTPKTQEINELKPLSYEINSKGNIAIAGVDLEDIARTYGTPAYVLCEETIRARAQAYEQAFAEHYPNHLTLYASKALNCKAISKLIAEEGLGLDVVSDGELYTALSVDFPAEKIVLHGNNKLYPELKMAIENNIGAIILDNFQELDLIRKIALGEDQKEKSRYKFLSSVEFANYDGEVFGDKSLSSSKEINILIRVSPGIECHTHEYIKTGKIDSKFGFNLEELTNVLEKLIDLQSELSDAGIKLNIRGLHAHIGSQIFETVPHQDTVKVLMELYKKIRDSFKLEFEDLNVGGGLGIKYQESDDPPEISDWVSLIASAVKKYAQEFGLKEPRILVEPGRSMVGPAGVTLYRVGAIKEISEINRKYISVDGGMADNSRPIMYQAEYKADLVSKPLEKLSEVGVKRGLETVTVAGRYCESGDILIQSIDLPKIETDDLLIIYSTGAYNYSMASNYNRTNKIPVLLVKDGKVKTIVKRESYEDLLSLDEE